MVGSSHIRCRSGLVGRTLAGIAVAAAVLAVLLARAPHGTTVVHAADTWIVAVGGEVEELSFSSNAYFPAALTIRAGDAVSFRWAADHYAHTVTFTRTEPPPARFIPGPGPGEQTGTIWLNPVGGAVYDG